MEISYTFVYCLRGRHTFSGNERVINLEHAKLFADPSISGVTLGRVLYFHTAIVLLVPREIKIDELLLLLIAAFSRTILIGCHFDLKFSNLTWKEKIV